MQIKQTTAAIYASLILILTFELSFSQSILANLAVFMGCIIFLIGQRKSRLLLWLFFLPLLPAIGTFWSIYLHGTSSQQAWLLFSRTYAFAGLGLAFAVGVDFEELLLLLEQKGLAPNFVYGILVVVHALPEVKREINDLKEASLLRGKTFHFWSPLLYVKTLLVAVSWRDKYTEAMSAHGYEEGATRSRKEHFVSAKVSLVLAILIIIFTNLFIFLT